MWGEASQSVLPTSKMFRRNAVGIEGGGCCGGAPVQVLSLVVVIPCLECIAGGGEARDENGQVGQGEGLVLDQQAKSRHAVLAPIEAFCDVDHPVAGADRLQTQRAADFLDAQNIDHRHHIALQAIVIHDAAFAEKGWLC